MKITIEQYEHTVTHKVPQNDVDLDEALRMCEGLLKAIGYHFSGNLEIVDEWKDNEDSFRIVDEPNEPKIRVGDATITTYDEFGVKHETFKQQEQCKCGKPKVGGYSCQRTDCNQTFKQQEQ